MFHSSKELEANSDLSDDLYGSGPVLNAYMLDQSANESYNSLQTPTFQLITTVNTKRIEGQFLIEYLSWSAQNQDVAVMVNASEVTKAETLTIREIFAFLKQEPAQLPLITLCGTLAGWCTYISNLKTANEPVFIYGAKLPPVLLLTTLNSKTLGGMYSEKTLSYEKGVLAETLQLIMGKGFIPVDLDA
ncbi:hypothetical protein Bca101_021285 [Brassica carinata]